MNNKNFQTIIAENKYEQVFNPNQNYSCQYYDEGEFIINTRNDDNFLNVFSLNIRSHPKKWGRTDEFSGDSNNRIPCYHSHGNRHICDIGVRLQSELPNYGNRFLEYLPPRISDFFFT